MPNTVPGIQWALYAREQNLQREGGCHKRSSPFWDRSASCLKVLASADLKSTSQSLQPAAFLVRRKVWNSRGQRRRGESQAHKGRSSRPAKADLPGGCSLKCLLHVPSSFFLCWPCRSSERTKERAVLWTSLSVTNTLLLCAYTLLTCWLSVIIKTTAAAIIRLLPVR